MVKSKIAFFISSLNVGGVENVFATYASELSVRGYKIDFVVCKPEGKLLNRLSDTVRIISLGNIKLRNSFFPLLRYLIKERPEVLIAGPDIANLVAILCKPFLRKKTKIIISQHNFFNIELDSIGAFSSIIPFLEKRLYKYADKVIAVSHGVECFLRELNVHESKISVVYNPIDIGKVNELSVEQVHSLKDDYILFVGRLSVVKNLSLLIDSFYLLHETNPNLKLLLVGDGDDYKNISLKASKLNLDKFVVFMGAMSNPYPLIKNAKLLVLTSYSESFSMVVLEALSLGVTVVSTPTKGPQEILGKEFGYFSREPNNPKDFFLLMKYALDNPLNPEVLKSRAMNFDVHILANSLENVINLNCSLSKNRL